MVKEKIIQQGAEAVLVRKGPVVIKRRIAKGYRIKEMDEALRRRRTRREGKVLAKAGKLIRIPGVRDVDEKKMEIAMDFVDGIKLSEGLDELENWKEVCERIGRGIGKLHDEGIIHGDLTTSNMILSEGEVWFIDFGLSFKSDRVEDKAVDLHLIKQALEAKHYARFEGYYEGVIEGYKKESSNALKVIDQLEKVERRGRYNAQF